MQSWRSMRAQQEIARHFDVKAGLHLGSVLSPLLFVIVMDIITTEHKQV